MKNILSGIKQNKEYQNVLQRTNHSEQITRSERTKNVYDAEKD